MNQRLNNSNSPRYLKGSRLVARMMKKLLEEHPDWYIDEVLGDVSIPEYYCSACYDILNDVPCPRCGYLYR